MPSYSLLRLFQTMFQVSVWSIPCNFIILLAQSNQTNLKKKKVYKAVIPSGRDSWAKRI